MLFKKKENKVEKRYDTYGKELEELGLLKPIYTSERITVCNVCNYCYYIIYKASGVAINITAESIEKNIGNPMKLLKLFCKLPYEEQIKSSFMIADPRIKRVLIDVREKVQNDPTLSQTDPEVDRRIIEKYGDPNIN